MAEKDEDDGLRLIGKMRLCKLLGVSESTIDRWVRSDPAFPQPRRLGPGAIRWVWREVMDYIDRLPRADYDDHSFDPNA